MRSIQLLAFAVLPLERGSLFIRRNCILLFREDVAVDLDRDILILLVADHAASRKSGHSLLQEAYGFRASLSTRNKLVENLSER